MASGVPEGDLECYGAWQLALDGQGPDGEQGVRQALGRALKDAVIRCAGEGVVSHGVGAGAHSDDGGGEGEAIASVLVGGRQVRGAALTVQVQRRAGVSGGVGVGGSVVEGSRGVGQEGVARAGHNALHIGRSFRRGGVGNTQHALHTDGKDEGQLAGEFLAAGGGVGGGDKGAVLALAGGGEGDRSRAAGIDGGGRGREDPAAVLGRDYPADVQRAAAAVAGGERQIAGIAYEEVVAGQTVHGDVQRGGDAHQQSGGIAAQRGEDLGRADRQAGEGHSVAVLDVCRGCLCLRYGDIHDALAGAGDDGYGVSADVLGEVQ